MTALRILAVSLTAALVAACSSNTVDSKPAMVPGMVHIHGLGINPADKRLYVATHYGLFRAGEGQASQRVGDLAQDFMGFTVTGNDEFLASGHPDPSDRSQPPHLGLIRSDDAGQSWESLSLKGSADFHALEYRHDRIYGHDSQSGRVLISTDERSWQQRAEIAAYDLAASPADADDILATTRQGLLRSTDGAVTFDVVAGAPTLVFVSWPDSGPLIGVDAQGTLYTSNDSRIWQAQHRLNAKPQALLAAGNRQVYVATDTAIYQSGDNGATVSVLSTID
ncbi:F510_1955 family glycosylhydrolase [Mycolicibacterium chlorophenolicum]|uniref:BNR/Asp-box repeat protein n=1 Tax=Mycolicibacterium chlorophenolicum TaxID=37916 RepID=A0A0J6YSQ8_9MYCO|nr:hypothetical protein [Mycolicibacterium chlorophenolicum]KMO75556.1 hypothetical protein MCHLDSM_03221 [Mycolicibacterium chlorophenolicum]